MLLYGTLYLQITVCEVCPTEQRRGECSHMFHLYYSILWKVPYVYLYLTIDTVLLWLLARVVELFHAYCFNKECEATYIITGEHNNMKHKWSLMGWISWVGFRNASQVILYLDCYTSIFQKGAILPSDWKSNSTEKIQHTISFLENWRLVQWWKQLLGGCFCFWK